jgi:hypothetical protein
LCCAIRVDQHAQESATSQLSLDLSADFVAGAGRAVIGTPFSVSSSVIMSEGAYGVFTLQISAGISACPADIQLQTLEQGQRVPPGAACAVDVPVPALSGCAVAAALCGWGASEPRAFAVTCRLPTDIPNSIVFVDQDAGRGTVAGTVEIERSDSETAFDTVCGVLARAERWACGVRPCMC